MCIRDSPEAKLQEALANQDLRAQLEEKPNTKGKYAGSVFKDGKYQAFVMDGKKRLTFGYYSTPEEAALVALLKRKELDNLNAPADAGASSTPLPTHSRAASSKAAAPKHPPTTPATRVTPSKPPQPRLQISDSESE